MTKHATAQPRRLRAHEGFALTLLTALMSQAYAQQAPAAASQQLDTVVVTGIRSSLAQSAKSKREDVGLSETVFAEDLGKFPDPSIVDSLSRIPGVNITRASIDGEGLNISIRGMGPQFTRVLLNGAPMASASAGSWGGNISANREVDMDFLPSELFSSASVYKSQKASIIEGGIAGTVNMRSARPFDKAGFRSAFTLSGNYRDQNKQWGTTGSALVSNTWDTKEFGGVGVLAGVAFGDTHYRSNTFQTVDMRSFQLNSSQKNASDNYPSISGEYMTTPLTVPTGLDLSTVPDYAKALLVPGKTIDRAMLLALNPGATIQQIDNALMGRLARHMVFQGERKRISGILSLQWQPNDQTDVYVDTLVARKGNEMFQNGMNVGTRPQTAIPIGMEFDRSDCSSGCVLNKVTLANTFWSMEYRPMKEVTRFGSINPGFEFRPNDEITIDGHFNATNSNFYRDMPSVLVSTNGADSVITYDNSKGGLPTITSNLDLNDPKNFGWYQPGQGLSTLRMDLYERTNTTRGTRANLKWGSNNFNVRVGGSWDDIERRYRQYGTGGGGAGNWINATCSNNINFMFIQPNTASQGACDGRVQPGPIAASVYPGFGQGATAGQSGLAYLGSLVPNSAVPNYLYGSKEGFVLVNWDKFAKDTNYQLYRDNIYKNFGNGSGGYLREIVTGFYTEVNGKVDVLGRALRYNAGIRFAGTEQTIGVLQAVADSRNAANGNLNGSRYPDIANWAYESTPYTNTMPSASASYNLTESIIARASASKSITRANPADLRQTQLTINDQSARTASLTNPKLSPWTANNFDFALEYYLSREAFLSASAFAKDIVGRPGSRITQYTLAQLDALYGFQNLTDAQNGVVTASGGRDKHLVEVTEPISIDSKLKVRGFELTWQQPLDMLPIKGFGFTANYTKTKQTDERPNSPPVAGVPPKTTNLTVYYERGGWSFRVARQSQATMVTNTGTGINVPGAYQYMNARTQIDLSAGADLKKILGSKYAPSVNFSVWNLTDAVTEQYVQFPAAVFDNYKPGRSFTLSLRSSF
ncbi:TonB-dependent receptor [Roseateles sp.]|uniref:TonB-dependent receptor n=1 Tax=Roseateles sp. TaxID=1971397 RepID=UPI0039464290